MHTTFNMHLRARTLIVNHKHGWWFLDHNVWQARAVVCCAWDLLFLTIIYVNLRFCNDAFVGGLIEWRHLSK